MSGHIIIVTKTGGAIDQDVIIIREDTNPELFDEIVGFAKGEPITLLWPTEYKVLTQAFGINSDYYSQFGLPGHEGLDMRAYTGTLIRAAWDGMVIGNYNSSTYGWTIKTECVIRGDTYEMIYAHMESQSKLQVGQAINKSDFIGFADSTGNSTGSHLHFTLKKRGATESGETDYKNDIIDPTNFFEELRDK